MKMPVMGTFNLLFDLNRDSITRLWIGSRLV